MSPSFLWLIIIKCSPKMDTSEIVHNLLRTSPFWILDFAWLNNNFWEQWITFSIWNITLSLGWPFWKVAMVSLTCWSLLLFDCVIMLNLSRLFKISHIFVFTGFFFLVGCLFWLQLRHMGVSGPGIEPIPQQQPELLQWQCWIINPLCQKRTPKFCFCFFVGLHQWHMEVPRLGFESEL